MSLSSLPFLEHDEQPANGCNDSTRVHAVDGECSVGIGRDSVSSRLTFNGTITTSGTVRITSVTIHKKSGNRFFFSSDASGVQPWTGQFDSATQLTVNNATLSVPGVGACGPSKLTLEWTSTANYDPPTILFRNVAIEPNCAIFGAVVVAPGLIVQ